MGFGSLNTPQDFSKYIFRKSDKSVAYENQFSQPLNGYSSAKATTSAESNCLREIVFSSHRLSGSDALRIIGGLTNISSEGLPERAASRSDCRALQDSDFNVSSSTYVPRAPRHPHLPPPPADEFGEWDEYRDDFDPGYRVYTAPSSSLFESSAVSYIDDSTRKPRVQAVNESCGEDSPFSLLSAIDFDSPSGDESLVQQPTKDKANGPRKQTTRYDGFGGSSSVKRPLVASPKTVDHGAPMRLGQNECDTQSSSLVVYRKRKVTGGYNDPKDMEISEGMSIVGRFEVEKCVGAAAFSRAYSAQDSARQRRVCLKVINNVKEFFDQGLDEIEVLKHLKKESEGFSSELREVARRCVVEFFETFYYREHLFIVTELLGMNLYDMAKLERQKGLRYFSIGRVQSVAKQISEALSFVHAAGVVHCDLKPENVLFADYGSSQVKLVDFGSSCFYSDKRRSDYIQSRFYRAPEVILGLGRFDEKVDVWSLGCLLFEIWTGYVLFQSDHVQALLARVAGVIGAFPGWMLSEGRNSTEYFVRTKESEGTKHSSVGFETYVKVQADDASGSASSARSGDCAGMCQVLVPKKSSLYQRARSNDASFVDFLCVCLQIDPALRLSVSELLGHEFLVVGRYADGVQAT